VGEFLTKRLRVEQVPYASQHLVDNDYIRGTSEAITEILPGGYIQMLIPESDYLEGPVPLESEEGRVLLTDALASN
jgi:hypothetical protein